jgi:hypothetical protein
MAEAGPEWYRIRWTEEGIWCANVDDRILDAGTEICEEALDI